ncbi:MAG: outer membrane protein assembly factor BamD [Flavobacteriales bacterium]|nr:MAG: outer membrane protein assembly factor BamD [Flavobacteriales bacterium]
MLKKWGVLIVLIAIISAGCSKYQKLLKSSDMDLKYEAAIKYYDAEKYEKAMALFEELIPLFRGTDRAEKVYYCYAYCNFQLNLLYSSSYHFKKFSTTYPLSEHAEETLFMYAYSNYLLSPSPTLDASDTRSGINALQLFINTYPKHKLVDSSNVLMDKLRAKLEIKSYLDSKQYFKIFKFKAAIISINNTLLDFPETEYREELTFLILKSNFLLAENSIKKKKLQRINDTIDAYYTFVDSFKESKYLKEAQTIFTKTSEMRNNIKIKNS